MKSHILIIALLPFLVLGCKERRAGEREEFVAEVMNGYTPVKDQGKGETCWAFAMLAAIETEHIGMGDSVNLSPYYAIRKVMERKAARCYFSGRRQRLSMRGTAMTLVNAIEADGVVPYDAYHGGKDANVTVAANKIGRIALARTGLDKCLRSVANVLDDAFGHAPRHVFMYGAEYTPQEFARSVCAPCEYKALTSFTHHPFYTSFALEIPDNRDGDLFFNVPIDTLAQWVEKAVRGGHGVCWEGDISERGFSFAKGIARLGAGASTTQESRQRAFERLATTDDHCMAIVGIAHDSQGRKYFVMKNSWGTDNPYGGLMYVSFDYFRLKTVAVFLSLPKVEPQPQS